MAWLTDVAAGLVACAISAAELLACAAGAAAPPVEPAAKPVPRVEFRWVESKHTPGVTEEKGVRLSETGELSYLHKTAALSVTDITKGRISSITFMEAAGPREMFMVHFELTAEARARLAADVGPRGEGLLAAVVDGRTMGAPYFRAATAATFEPFAGYFASRDEVERIIGQFK